MLAQASTERGIRILLTPLDWQVAKGDGLVSKKKLSGQIVDLREAEYDSERLSGESYTSFPTVAAPTRSVATPSWNPSCIPVARPLTSGPLTISTPSTLSCLPGLLGRGALPGRLF